MSDERRSPLRGYVTAIIAVAVAAVLRTALEPALGDRAPYVTFYAAIAVAALYGDLRASLLAVALSSLVATRLFVIRDASSLSSGQAVWLALFMLAGGVIVALAHRFQMARASLAEAAESQAKQAAGVQAERQRLRDILTSIPGVVWEAWGQPDSSQQRIDFVSEYVETMLGYKPDEWTSTPNFWLRIVHPDDRAHAAQTAAEMFARGGTGENEFRWLARDGRPLWVVARSTTIVDEHGAPIGMRGVTLDITQRKEIEQRLAVLAEIATTGLTGVPFRDLAEHIARRAAVAVGDYCVIRMLRGDRLETVASAHRDRAGDAMVRVIAAQSQLSTINSHYAEIVQHPRTIIENDLTAESFAHVVRDGMEADFDRYRARRGVFTPLLVQGRLVGTLAIGRAGGEPFTSADAQFAEAIAARASLALENARLVAAAQHDAEEARQARAEAEEAGRVKDEFLATLSHELRTPLNAILGWAHLLRDGRLPEARRQSAIETILRNAQSQEQLISDILDVQRIVAGKIRLNLHIVDLGNVVRSAAETVQPSADAKGVRLQLLLDLDVPTVTGDPDRLQQVVWNLLTNAIKFAPSDGRVQVRLLKAEDACELVVEDNGPGIAPDFIPHMFERFRQADSSTTRTHQGLGLGLAIVRSLVEMHGGTISAGNTEVPGTTGAVFTIRLPRRPMQLSGPTDVVDRGAAWNGQATPLDGIHVLVIEDDTDGRELLTAILQRCQARVTAAASAAEGFAAFTRHQPDIIVSDIEMAHEDGYSLIRRIRELGPTRGGDVPAVALTAYASPADRLKVIGAGFNMHLAKPVQPAELAVVLASLAGRHV
jgi:PAS domain S-box-containing protein